jgi:hypothetical protein
MVLTGFCDKQNKNYSVELKMVDSSDLEKQHLEIGRLICQYATLSGCCRNPKQCSILQNLTK